MKILNWFRRKRDDQSKQLLGKYDYAIQDGPSEIPRRWALECDKEGNFLVWGQKLAPGQRIEVKEVL